MAKIAERNKTMKNAGETNITLHELATSYLQHTMLYGQPTRWYWRDNWYVWKRSHYERVGTQVIERDVLYFLHGKVDLKLSIVRGIVQLLRLLQFCEAIHAPAWLQEDRSPDPKDIFALKNGLLYLREDHEPELLAHDPAYWALAAAEYAYSKDAVCHYWMRFLAQLWAEDGNEKEVLQEWFGYCLLANTCQQKILAIIGLPRSGKGTIARVLIELLGRSNVANPFIRSLSGEFGMWALLDKTLAIIPDATLPKPSPALEELLKSISGEDSVDIHRKGIAPLNGVRMPTRLMLLANELPAFRDPSGALDRRLVVLKTDRTFLGKEDIRLTNKLLEELPGILNWAIEGLMRLWKRGHFPDSEAGIDADGILAHLPEPNRIRKIVITYEHT
jgi:putative DNA primase/helicase